ncbi:M28 family metallopeptidase [Clostridium nigeriense]|uniref:M28 family metallopeptidase n=1 Tax=Clostridium nigeriense TaxID=1805470 RepID=UPI003D355EA8
MKKKTFIILAIFFLIVIFINKIINKDIYNIRNIINYLCSDEINDREFKSYGNQKASDYINNLYKEMDLEFVFEDSYLNSFNYDLIKINNIIGKISGENNKKAIILTAHFDAWYNGAVDNASGVSAVIEIAKKLKEFSETNKLNQDVIFLMTNAEMNGYKGSEDFVLKLSELNYENVYNINIDCIGIKDSINSSGLGLKNLSHLEESKKLYSGIKEVLGEYEIDYTEDFSTEKSRLAYEQGYGVSDYVSFEKNGYPNIHISQKDIGEFILNENDDPNLIDYRKIKKISEALAQYIKEVDF